MPCVLALRCVNTVTVIAGMLAPSDTGGNTATKERIVEVPVPQPAAASVQPETNRGSDFDPRNIDNATATTAGKHYTGGDHPVRVSISWLL